MRERRTDSRPEPAETTTHIVDGAAVQPVAERGQSRSSEGRQISPDQSCDAPRHIDITYWKPEVTPATPGRKRCGADEFEDRQQDRFLARTLRSSDVVHVTGFSSQK
jgi:hypothetical protein